MSTASSTSMLPSYPLLSGHHLPTNGPRNLLTHAGLRLPGTDTPITAALALGISGGLGCGYILWQFKGHIGTVLTLGFTYRWNYGTEAPQQLCERLGATVRWHDTGSAKKAAADLDAALDAGRPAVAWLDQVHLGYLRQPTHLEGCFGWHATVCGRTEDGVLLHDLGRHPRAVSHEVLAASRKRIGSYKHRLMTVEALRPLSASDWSTAVRAGVADTTRYLSDKSASFSIPAIRKWARMVVDDKNKKGWPKAFPGGVGLASALESTWHNVAQGLSDGTGLRATYADFCREGALLADWTELAAIAPLWDTAADRWRTVAEVALPSDVAELAELRRLAEERWSLLHAPPSPEVEARLDATMAALEATRARLDTTFPEADSPPRLQALSDALMGVVDAENAAIAAMTELS